MKDRATVQIRAQSADAERACEEALVRLEVPKGRVARLRQPPGCGTVFFVEFEESGIEGLSDALRGVDAPTRIVGWIRKFSKAELEAAPWLWLRFNSVEVSGPVQLGGDFDFHGACEGCGAGARPREPILVDVGKVRGGGIARTYHSQELIVTSAVRDTLEVAKLTGVRFRGVRRRSGPVATHHWLDIAYEWPRTSSRGGLIRAVPCPRCERAGWVLPLERPAELRYDSAPSDAADFGHTWEYFGERGRRRVGGCQEVIVSQSARRALLASGAKVSFECISLAH